MASVRTVVNGALRKLGRLGAGREARTADATDTLSALQGLYNSWVAGGAFGRLCDVVPTGEIYTAVGNERIVRDSEATLTVQLPELMSSAWIEDYGRPNNRYYGTTVTITDLVGETIIDIAVGQPIGNDTTTPKDGAPVVITDRIGGQVQTWLYEGTLKRWQLIDGLELDSEAPRSHADPEGLSAMLAMEMADTFGVELGATTIRQANRFQSALTTRWGMRREQVCGSYF